MKCWVQVVVVSDPHDHVADGVLQPLLSIRGEDGATDREPGTSQIQNSNYSFY